MRALASPRGGRARRCTAWLGALAAGACTGAGVDPHGLPVCEEAKPAPETDCELGAEAEEWKRDAVLALWGYVGSELRRLPVSVAFDSAARVDPVCLAPGASVPRPARESVGRGMRSLASMRRAPACLADRSLSLADAWAAEAKRWRGKQSRERGAENRCTSREPRCPSVGLPVCGLRDDGRRVEFPNRCEACQDSSIVGYDERPCGF